MKNKLSVTLGLALVFSSALGLTSVKELKEHKALLTEELISTKSTLQAKIKLVEDLTVRSKDLARRNSDLEKDLSYKNEKLLEATNDLNKELSRLSVLIPLGTFESTAYSTFDNGDKLGGKPGNNKTASGTIVKEGRTVAVDRRKIPLGTKLYIKSSFPGVTGVYTAEDTGSAIKGNIVDIYFDNVEVCKQFGRQKVEVFLLK